MAYSGDETEEDDNVWGSNFVESAPLERPDVFGPGLNKTMEPYSTHRVILHFDLDCFYAQVEMIRNPALREVPLGVQQKYIIVTCNYVAREQGLTKLMSVADAKEKCPQLVLVNGEDLTHYREMSYKVTELLMSYCPLVERLGFDENFMDVTEMVEKRLSETSDLNNLCFKGNVYNRYSADVKASDYSRLAVGSHIAAEIREAIHSRLGLTGCGGVATNKLLAKLVSGTFKPNQQTALLPENISDIMSCLSSLRKVPGVGHQTSKRLQALGLVSVKDLQLCPLNDLVKEFGAHSAERLKNLVMGIDTSPVTATGAPQSLSDEDSFKKISSTKDVLEKVQQLLSSLVERMYKDGRQPQTFRLTIRRYSATNKWLSRESRQCPVPYHTGQKITSGSSKEAVVLLLPLAMKLFQKMVDGNSPFHLTLINVCFSNLQARGVAVTGKGSITAFLTHGTSPSKTPACSPQKQNDSSNSEKNHSLNSQPCLRNNIFLCSRQKTLTTKSTRGSEAVLHELKRKQSCADAVEPHLQTEFTKKGPDPDDKCHSVSNEMPSNFDPDVFKLLPEDIQQELLSSSYINSLPSTSADSSQLNSKTKNTSPGASTRSEDFEDPTETVDKPDPLSTATIMNHHRPLAASECSATVTERGRMSFPLSSDCKFPGNVDPEVFSELPADVQRELMSEWKQQKPALKVLSSRKPGALPKTKDKKSARKKTQQTNSLLNYFKSS